MTPTEYNTSTVYTAGHNMFLFTNKLNHWTRQKYTVRIYKQIENLDLVDLCLTNE